MHALDDTDRTAVLLRFFENKSLREVGESLGTTDRHRAKACQPRCRTPARILFQTRRRCRRKRTCRRHLCQRGSGRARRISRHDFNRRRSGWNNHFDHHNCHRHQSYCHDHTAKNFDHRHFRRRQCDDAFSDSTSSLS